MALVSRGMVGANYLQLLLPLSSRSQAYGNHGAAGSAQGPSSGIRGLVPTGNPLQGEISCLGLVLPDAISARANPKTPFLG